MGFKLESDSDDYEYGCISELLDSPGFRRLRSLVERLDSDFGVGVLSEKK